MNTLYAKLSIALLGLFLVIGLCFFMIARVSSNQYYLEVTQRLNSAIAMYVVDQHPLIQNGEVQTEVLQALSEQAMIINPAVEVYLISPEGRLMNHHFDEASIQNHAVDIEPIEAFLDAQAELPIVNTDPRHDSQQKIFSAFPVMDQGQLAGYIYVVLGGTLYDDLMSRVGSDYVMTVLAWAIGLLLLLGLGVGLLLFQRITRRLSALTSQVLAFRQPDSSRSVEVDSSRDELDVLDTAFAQMSQRISHQVRHIQSVDQARRDLVSNISHDLRTPLSSMQGYLDTLLIKPGMAESLKVRYLKISRSHCQRLGKLIGELFELSRLDQHGVEPHFEVFSITELLQDVSHEFQLKASREGIQLTLDLAPRNILVNADIGLIQRVLENLIDNAIRHTPIDGQISLSMISESEQVRLMISDTGKGIQTTDLAHIFERHYQALPAKGVRNGAAGLGLAIVKRILDLHKVPIFVDSREQHGTTFTFYLNQPSSAAA